MIMNCTCWHSNTRRYETLNHTRWCYYSVTKLWPTLCEPVDCSMPGFPVLHYLPEFAQTHVHCVDDVIQPPPLFSLLYLPSSFPSSRVFSNESAFCIRWPKYWRRANHFSILALRTPWTVWKGKNTTGVGCHFLLQRVFPTQRRNLPLLHCQWILHPWATWEGLWS